MSLSPYCIWFTVNWFLPSEVCFAISVFLDENLLHYYKFLQKGSVLEKGGVRV